MTTRSSLEWPRNGSLEVAKIPDPSHGAVEARRNLLKLNQIIEEAPPELIDVDERNRRSALRPRKVAEGLPIPLDEPRHEGVVRLPAVTLPPWHLYNLSRLSGRCGRRKPFLCHVSPT
jgi:hypothetical protein